MRVLFRRSAAAIVLALLIEMCPVAFGQVSFGIGGPAHRIAEARILQQLESRDSFVHEDIPLDEFARLLSERYGINVVIDQRALEDFGIDMETPLSIHLQEATLESALNVVLKSIELTWMIRDEALLITTPEEAEAQLETRLYPVRDLVVVEFAGKAETDFEGLIRPIISTIAPDSWDYVGGPGSIEPQTVPLSLFISQTWRVHRKIERLLTTVREVRDKQGISQVNTAWLPRAVRQSTPRPPRRYRASTNANWQRPRVYE